MFLLLAITEKENFIYCQQIHASTSLRFWYVWLLNWASETEQFKEKLWCPI